VYLKIRQLIIYLCSSIAGLLLATAAVIAGADDWVPEGFEALTRPQKTVVDVFYGGVYLTSVPARFEPGSITVLNASPIIALLPDLEDPLDFRKLIEFPLDTNEQLRCKSRDSIDCGRLETKTVGVIFSRNRLRFDLFIGPDLLKIISLDKLQFLPKSDGGLSVIDDLAFYASGSTGADLTYNMSNDTLISYAENRLKITSNITTDDNLTIDTLALQRERSGFDYEAGIFRANAGSFLFMQNQQFFGAKFETSLTTRLNLETALGTTFNVFLTSRSLVQIFKDGRLLGSSYYGTGNQEIDTTSLPQGAYDVELQITDSAGAVRIERRFYSKNPRIPPEGQSLYFIQGGQYVETVSGEILPRTTDDSFIRAGYSRRLFSSLAGNIGFSSNTDSTMIEGGFFYQGEHFELSTALAYDQYSRLASDIRFNYRYALGSFSLGIREISGGDVEEGEQSQLGQKTSQLSANGNITTKSYGNFALFGDYTRSNDEAEYTESYGVSWSRSLFALRGDWKTRLELSSNDGDTLFLCRLEYSWEKDAWNSSASTEYKAEKVSQSENINEMTGGISTRWRNNTAAGNDYSASLRVDYQDQDSVQSNFDAKTNHGMAGISARHNIDEDTWEYNASMRTSLAANTKGVYVGGKDSGNSGFVVRVDGPEGSDNLIDVKFGGSTRATIKANQDVLIPAGAYRTYDISFSPFGDSIETISYRGRPLTLYPGNVIPVRAKLTQVLLAIGRVYLRSGKPLQNALIKGAEGLALTDGNGFFQAEIIPDVKELTFVVGEQSCVVQLPEYQTRRNVATLGKLTCDLQE
jgi:outer membrane usher protein FimD/PapC